MNTGGVVKLADPAPNEISARYVVVEWNGDRGMIRLLCDLPIPPIELVRIDDIAKVPPNEPTDTD